jgi:hypothetical protein
VADFGQHNPLNLIRTCKNQQAMLAGKATHNNKMKKNLCFRAEIFHINFFMEKVDFR